jgi:putative ABC transport system permease protein
MLIFRLIFESFRFAWEALKANPLRTILSLLGVTIGIFAIIAVYTLVDSLENSIKSSFSFLGADNLNVEKWPYGFDNNYPWWKYVNRPNTVYEEFEFLEENISSYKAATFMARRGGVNIKRKSNNIGNNTLIGVSYGFAEVYDLKIAEGRYFSIRETNSGSNVAVIGYEIAQALFPGMSPVGNEIKIKGLKFTVIGVVEQEGKSFVGITSNDENCFIPYQAFEKLYYAGKYRGVGTTITLQGNDNDPNLVRLEGEIRGLMRLKRGLKPKEEDDFAINRPEMIAEKIGSVFDVIGFAGTIIGSFSILVGCFGIANIMFVSVQERITIIGIQKSLGAKNYFILLQFLFEAVFLSLIGGGTGILMVYLLSFVSLGSLDLVLNLENIIIGVLVSMIVGVASGIIPAYKASRLNPVAAIRN